jgi:hypothetical protein
VPGVSGPSVIPRQRTARATLCAALCALAIAPAGGTLAQEFTVVGQCRDGAPHGAYELRMPDGRVRVSGAFNRGKRTGTFLFWSSGGARLALLPYEDDALNGTVALWYLATDPRAEPRPKLEAAYVMGRLSGTKRSWYPDGRRRAEFDYKDGTLAAARAWSASAAPLPEEGARAMADRDARDDAGYYETLLQIVRDNPPACGTSAHRSA